MDSLYFVTQVSPGSVRRKRQVQLEELQAKVTEYYWTASSLSTKFCQAQLAPKRQVQLEQLQAKALEL